MIFGKSVTFDSFTWRDYIAICAAALGIAVAARLAFPIPGTEIPQTGQTVAVLLVGALLGTRRGSLAVLLYLLAGVAGLPVYSEGASGWSVLSGPSAGYFVGFVVAAGAMGRLLTPGRHGNFLDCFAGMLLGHGLILLAGWCWMSVDAGPAAAFDRGVAPFLYGGLAKSLLTAGILIGKHYLKQLWPLWNHSNS